MKPEIRNRLKQEKAVRGETVYFRYLGKQRISDYSFQIVEDLQKANREDDSFKVTTEVYSET